MCSSRDQLPGGGQLVLDQAVMRKLGEFLDPDAGHAQDFHSGPGPERLMVFQRQVPAFAGAGIFCPDPGAGLVTLADKGYQGSAYAKIPYKGKNKPQSQKQAIAAHARLRPPGERANAQLKTWRILRKLRCCPWRACQLAKAIHALQIREANAG